MEITPLFIPGAFVISPNPHIDHRGYFMRTYDEAIFLENELNTVWPQENQSLSQKAFTIRGLHCQSPPESEIKLVSVGAGSVFDVLVDLRVDSPTFGKWFGTVLSTKNRKMLYIPKGCAHGFCTLVEESIINYKVSTCYHPASEKTLNYNDGDLSIEWPIPDSVEPTTSEKDRTAPYLSQFESPFSLRNTQSEKEIT